MRCLYGRWCITLGEEMGFRGRRQLFNRWRKYRTKIRRWWW
jgi:hypothetical protein